MGDAISAQGTIIERDPLGVGSFAAVAELRDISGPALSRNPIETTNHNDSDESFVVGIRRHGEVTFTVGYIPTNASHDSSTGLIKSWQDGQRDVFRVTYPDGSEWVFSGFISNFASSAPVDDGLTADVSIRTTGQMLFNDS
jgi:hypothetical protein